MRARLPLLVLMAGCVLDDFDESSVDRGTDPGPPWLTEDEENGDPVAIDDVAHAFDGYATVVGVLDNDSDPDFNALSVTKVANPSNGSSEINDDGTVTYTPDGGFEGEDTFTYTIEDGKGGEAKAAVVVTVGGPATIVITSPVDQAQVTVPFDIVFEYDGSCTLALSSDDSQGCHIHLVLDGDDSDFPDLDGDGFSDAAYDADPLQVLETGEALSPGEHTIEMALWRNDASHAAYDPRISHQITIFVEGGTDPVDTAATDTSAAMDTSTGSTVPTDTSDTGASDTSDTGASDTSDTGASDTSDTGASDTSDTGASDTSDTGASDTSDTGASDTSVPSTPSDTSDTASSDTSYNDTGAVIP
jgi:hypothetical protein